MWKVTEEEDTGECGDTECDGGEKLGCEGLPKLALREEVEDALRNVSFVTRRSLTQSYSDGIEVSSRLSSILCQLGHSLRFLADCLLDLVLCSHDC